VPLTSPTPVAPADRTLNPATKRMKKSLMPVRSTTSSTRCGVCSSLSCCLVDGSVQVAGARTCSRYTGISGILKPQHGCSRASCLTCSAKCLASAARS
jgi:hypothetical protein